MNNKLTILCGSRISKPIEQYIVPNKILRSDAQTFFCSLVRRSDADCHCMKTTYCFLRMGVQWVCTYNALVRTPPPPHCGLWRAVSLPTVVLFFVSHSYPARLACCTLARASQVAAISCAAHVSAMTGVDCGKLSLLPEQAGAIVCGFSCTAYVQGRRGGA